jgi:hypothetical protein
MQESQIKDEANARRYSDNATDYAPASTSAIPRMSQEIHTLQRRMCVSPTRPDPRLHSPKYAKIIQERAETIAAELREKFTLKIHRAPSWLRSVMPVGARWGGSGDKGHRKKPMGGLPTQPPRSCALAHIRPRAAAGPPPNSGTRADIPGPPLWAMCRLMRCSKQHRLIPSPGQRAPAKPPEPSHPSP